MRVALTGGSSGIGAAVAARLKRDGHHVTAFDFNEPKENIDAWIELDLSDANSIVAATEKVKDQSFDVLINNAGLPPREGNAELVLQVNYFGLKAFMDLMLDRIVPGGAIVNTASRAGSMWRDNIEQVKALMALGSGEGLAELRSAGAVRVPEVYDVGADADGAFIEMERLALRRGGDHDAAALGEQLAALHRHTAEQHGWHRDNTIGLTPQPNPQNSNWIEFFREHRLRFQLGLAEQKGYGAELQELGGQMVGSILDF